MYVGGRIFDIHIGLIHIGNIDMRAGRMYYL